MKLYLIEINAEDLSDYEFSREDVLGIADSKDNAMRMIENWADSLGGFYVDLEEKDEEYADKVYKGISPNGDEWEIDIFISEKELNEGL